MIWVIARTATPFQRAAGWVITAIVVVGLAGTITAMIANWNSFPWVTVFVVGIVLNTGSILMESGRARRDRVAALDRESAPPAE